jgi:UDP-glucose 4-epimerase
MKRVIVTGANGFVGSNIVSTLLEQGWFVYALDLGFDNPAVDTWDNNRTELITSPCVNLPTLSVDALIHGAFITASPESRNESPEANLRANMEPMLAMMEYADQNKIGRSIFLSSSGVYRTMPDELIHEDRPQSPLGVYAVAKTMMEHLVETMQTVYRRDMICVRLGNIYGQNEYQRESRPFLSVIGHMIHMAITTSMIEVDRPDEIREWTYASDIGNAIHSLLQTDILNHTLYHVANTERASNLSIAYLIQSLIESTEVLITSEDTSKPKLTRLGILDNSRLAQDTGFTKWTPLSKGLLSPILGHSLRSKADA